MTQWKSITIPQLLFIAHPAGLRGYSKIVASSSAQELLGLRQAENTLGKEFSSETTANIAYWAIRSSSLTL